MSLSYGSTEIEDETDDEINPFAQYHEYSKVEAHMEFSRLLFLIDKKGKHVLSELASKKLERRRRNGTSVLIGDVKRLYTQLVHVLNVKRFSHRLFSSLQYHLDELLFKEVKEYDKFYIEDDVYDLTKLYYDPSSWLQNNDIQEFVLDESTDITISESMCLVCFLREYEDLLFSLEEYIRDVDYIELRNSIMKTIRCIKHKLKVIWDIVTNVISRGMKNDDS